MKILREREPGESSKDISLRVSDFLKQLSHKKLANVLIVSHAGTSRALTLMIEGRKAAEWESVEQLKKTAVSIFKLESGKVGKCLLWNMVLEGR